MMVLARWIKHPFDVTVQGSHDANPRQHRRAARRRDQDQGLHRSLPFRRLVLGLGQLGDEGPGILERDEFAAAGQRDRIVERALPSADQPSRCGLIRSDAVQGRSDLAHDKTSFDCGTRLCCSGLPGLSAGCQGFRRHDRNREHELRPLAVYARASAGRNHLDLWFLDRTQLRCCSK